MCFVGTSAHVIGFGLTTSKEKKRSWSSHDFPTQPLRSQQSTNLLTLDLLLPYDSISLPSQPRKQQLRHIALAVHPL